MNEKKPYLSTKESLSRKENFYSLEILLPCLQKPIQCDDPAETKRAQRRVSGLLSRLSELASCMSLRFDSATSPNEERAYEEALKHIHAATTALVRGVFYPSQELELLGRSISLSRLKNPDEYKNPKDNNPLIRSFFEKENPTPKDLFRWEK